MTANQLKSIKLNISDGSWKVGKPIDTISFIAKKFDISTRNSRKIIEELISLGIVEKYDKRFFLINRDFDNSVISIQKRLINKAKINLNILKLMHKKYIFDKITMSFINQNEMNIDIYFPIIYKKFSINIIDINKCKNIEIVNIIKRHKLK